MIIYLLAASLFGAGLWAILELGGNLQQATKADVSKVAAQDKSAENSSSAPRTPLSLLLLQVILIITSTRACARAARSLGQPEVIGEIAAGICLGPSLLGLLWPASQAHIFPPDSLGNLHFLSQVGLILFMFIVGMETNVELLKRKAHEALVISHVGILLPFLLGTALAMFLYKDYAPQDVPFTPFALFLGTAMSVTAFPVLARILHDKRLGRSALGSLVLACAAVDDVTAWCALAAVVGLTRHGSSLQGLWVAFLCGLFAAVMAFLIRPALARWMDRWDTQEELDKEASTVILLVPFASALVTETIGAHALFGAFLAGVSMPRKAALRLPLLGHLERFAALILLPLFFALTGLRTRIGLLQDAGSWTLCALVIATAIAGKFGGGALSARWSGMPWRQSLAVGTLMNARGLVELVVLNIGYDLGIITPAVFTMMVLMALATTFMTGPLLQLLLPSTQQEESTVSPPEVTYNKEPI